MLNITFAERRWLVNQKLKQALSELDRRGGVEALQKELLARQNHSYDC